MRRLASAALAAFFMVFGIQKPSAALAAHMRAPPECDDRERIIGYLAHQWKEAIVATALTNKGYLFEILRSVGGETYSVLLTAPPGPGAPKVTCIIGAGTDWRDIPFQAPGISAS